MSELISLLGALATLGISLALESFIIGLQMQRALKSQAAPMFWGWAISNLLMAACWVLLARFILARKRMHNAVPIALMVAGGFLSLYPGLYFIVHFEPASPWALVLDPLDTLLLQHGGPGSLFFLTAAVVAILGASRLILAFLESYREKTAVA